jgi:hypothetical protein
MREINAQNTLDALAAFSTHQSRFQYLGLKAHYHGYRYALEAIKMLSQKLDAIILANIFEQLARLGLITRL